LEKIKEERGYQYEDEVETPGEGDLQQMYAEHLHENEEIRFILEGCGYYDIRDNNDEWIRIEVLGGDLIVVPSGCYHRFMLDHTNVCRVKRIFLKDPQYTAHKRPVDNMDCRKEYLKKLENGAFEKEQ
jgi:1,2-dihydroxy-3-keto-5-methylthiopentene dioxygenase